MDEVSSKGTWPKAHFPDSYVADHTWQVERQLSGTGGCLRLRTSQHVCKPGNPGIRELMKGTQGHAASQISSRCSLSLEVELEHVFMNEFYVSLHASGLFIFVLLTSDVCIFGISSHTKVRQFGLAMSCHNNHGRPTMATPI